jgi:hypothetical protein
MNHEGAMDTKFGPEKSGPSLSGLRDLRAFVVRYSGRIEEKMDQTILSRVLRARASKAFAVAAVAFGLLGCASEEVERLREENARLRQLLAELEASSKGGATTIDEFTVGLAAAEKSFDEGDFVELLRTSLQESAAPTSRFAMSQESEEQSLAKVRGMLIQQYLSERKVPIRIWNLSFKLKDPSATFKLGGTPVPREGLVAEAAEPGDGSGGARLSFKGPLQAVMERDAAGRYSIPYEEPGVGSGTIEITVKDVEVPGEGEAPRVARQGDLSFNWQLSLEKIQVYRIGDFAGDIGGFLKRMRYPRSRSSLNQYQTVRDAVFLFGYGPYATGLVQRMQTPDFIDQVEVLALEPEVFTELEGGLPEEKLSELLAAGKGRWLACEFQKQEGNQKAWDRPAAVGFPFVSRQTSFAKGLVFYTKYDEKGSQLIGDYRMRGK